MKRWTVVQVNGSLREYANDWDQLRRQLFSANPMLSSRFVDGMLRHFGDGTEHLCIFGSRNTPLAMCLVKPRGPGIWATFLPSQAQIGPTLLNRLELVPDLLKSLPGFSYRIDFLCNDPAFGVLSDSQLQGAEYLDHTLTISIKLEGGFPHYWSSRSKNLVKNIARYERRMVADRIASKFVCVTDQAAISDAVLRYSALESKGWKGKAGTALSTENAQGDFYCDIADRFSTTGQAYVYELWLDNQLAASRIAIVDINTMVILKTTYAEPFGKYAPGRLLLRKVIQHAFATYPGGVIEFYTNANSDQLAWATEQRWIRHVTLYRGSVAGTIFSLLRIARNFRTTKDRT